MVLGVFAVAVRNGKHTRPLPDRADGVGFLTQIKRGNSPYQHMPVVVMSSSSDPQDKADAYRLGASPF